MILVNSLKNQKFSWRRVLSIIFIVVLVSVSIGLSILIRALIFNPSEGPAREIPFYPDSVGRSIIVTRPFPDAGNSNSTDISFFSNDNPAKIVSFYQQELAKLGWQPQSIPNKNDNQSQFWKRGDLHLTLDGPMKGCVTTTNDGKIYNGVCWLIEVKEYK